MTIEECRKYLPESWIEPIQNDPVLWDIFSEHEYDLEQEAVPPFLIQDLRGGDLERLRPILSLYGQPGLKMLEGLLEIDEASKDTAQIELPDGQIGYAGYFFAKSDLKQDAAKAAVIAAANQYIQAIHQIYTQIFEESAPIDVNPKITILSGKEGTDFQEQMHQDFVHNKFHPSDDIYDDIGDWFMDIEFQEECEDLWLFNEALYHISNDYFLSHYLQWSLIVPQPIENPFQGYFELWKMGFNIEFPEKDQVVLIAN